MDHPHRKEWCKVCYGSMWQRVRVNAIPYHFHKWFVCPNISKPADREWVVNNVPKPKE